MDTIDLSNLNRQFLFREADIGKSKAEVAARAVKARVEGVEIVYHHCSVQEKELNFYRQFDAVIAGLDSIEARRYLNNVLHKLVEYEEGNPIRSTQIPLIDGGTEGLKGNIRLILPGDPKSSCLECTLDLYPPQTTFPMCTIANTPRLPEHCIEYSKVVLWEKSKPFGENVSIDTDNSNHIQWLFEQARNRAEEFKIEGVTYRSTLGVVKNIIPAVSSTNAVVAAACVNECFKIVSFSLRAMNGCGLDFVEGDLAMDEDQRNETNTIFNQIESIYSFKYPTEKKQNCLICQPNNFNQKQKVCITKNHLFDKNLGVQDNFYKIKHVYQAILDKFSFKSCFLNDAGSGVLIYGGGKSKPEVLEEKYDLEISEILVSSQSLVTSLSVQIDFE